MKAETPRQSKARGEKPARTDVLIIGAGASGATAAKVLTEQGLSVVALERGPWRQKESFGGDELANINRYNLWPDPLLNPRTVHDPLTDKTRTQLFCPVPQMVGGGTVHWQGWLPRFTEECFRLHSVVGDLPGTRLVDWPISYKELEPYYTAVEWAFGVSGKAGANRYESFRSKGYPCKPMPQSRYAEKYHIGCNALGWNSFPTPQAALSEPYNGRPPTVISAFAQQHGDPSGTRSSALNVFVPDALATGLYEIRPNCYARQITVNSHGQAHGVVYEDEQGLEYEQEADIVILACGAVESARLLLLSDSARYPKGLANGSDMVGRNVTFHEFSSAVATFEDPIYAWAGGGYVAASSYEFFDHDEKRGFASGGHLAASGVGIPLPINWGHPDRPAWGADMKHTDRNWFNHSMAASMVIHDMPQHDNRVELDPEVTDAWGLPVARITLSPHENDLAMGKFLIDRSADIMEAAGASSVKKVYIDRVTGNCSHQHGTTRMGNNPDTSVLDRYCRSHDADNLYVVDAGSFPTATGANPTLTIMANAWRVCDGILEKRTVAQ